MQWRWGVCVVATAIGLGSAAAARAAVVMPVFGPASPVTELNSPDNDVPNWVSADGLHAVLHSRRLQGGDNLFSATRDSITEPFSMPATTEFANNNIVGHDIRAAVLSSTGLEMFYSDNEISQRRVMRATRADVASPFSPGVLVPGLFPVGDTDFYYPSYLSPDGLRLYYHRSRDSGAFVVTRASVGAAFGAPSTAMFVNVPGVTEPSLTPDELQMFYARGTQLYWTSRASVGSAFAPPQVLTSVTGINLGRPVFFNGDTLMFYQDLANGVSHGDIWMARIPEPAGVTLLTVISGATLVSRRRSRRNILANCG